MKFDYLLILGLLCVQVAIASESSSPTAQLASLQQLAARSEPHAAKKLILGATRAGKHLVAVGEHGVIIIADDDRLEWRQAKLVPTRATLNDVSFVDERNGWAVGHWGVILHTTDGGETWVLQRAATAEDRPLFAVHFIDGQHGIAVGLWSLMLRTEDGGASWKEVVLPSPPDGGKADRNLFGVFAASEGQLMVVAERGAVLRSSDMGESWTYSLTGYKGSFWTGGLLADGRVFVAGLRGTIYSSRDGGNSWLPVSSGTKSSLTAFSKSPGVATFVGLDGIRLNVAGHSVHVAQRQDRLPLTAVVTNGNGKLITFSRNGVVQPEQGP